MPQSEQELLRATKYRIGLVQTQALAILALDWGLIQKAGPNSKSSVEVAVGLQLQVLKGLCERIKRIQPELCDDESLQRLDAWMTECLGSARAVVEVSTANWDTQKIHVNGFTDLLRKLSPHILTFIEQKSHLFISPTDRADLENHIANALKDKISELDRLTVQFGTAYADMQAATEAHKTAALAEGAAAQSRFFSDLASRFVCESFFWLFFMCVSGVFVVGWAAYVVERRRTEVFPSVYAMVSDRIFEIIVLSVLATVFGLTIKSYSACRHNEVVNRFRTTAIQTFEAFWIAAKDQTIKDAVLLRACSSIFEHQATGFAKDSDSGSEGTKIIEVTKSLSTSERGGG